MFKLICAGNEVDQGDDPKALEDKRDAACQEQLLRLRLPESVLPSLLGQWSIVEA